jgi:uncharacterized protein with GYD domain
MPSYVMLMKLTAKGADEIDSSPERIAAAKASWEALGGTVTSFHATMGEYDFVAVGEGPNDLCAMAFAAIMTATGSVSVTTMKAFDEEQWSFILQAPGDRLKTGTVERIIGPTGSRKSPLP